MILLLFLLAAGCSGASPSAEAPPAATSGKLSFSSPSHAKLCAQQECRLLAHYLLSELEGEGMCRLCGEENPGLCAAPWPKPEEGQVPCAYWEELERCIWQTAGTRSMPDLDETARANVAELQRRIDGQVGCVP